MLTFSQAERRTTHNIKISKHDCAIKWYIAIEDVCSVENEINNCKFLLKECNNIYYF